MVSCPPLCSPSEDIGLGKARGGMDMKEQRVESEACWWAERLLAQAVRTAAPPGLGKRQMQRRRAYRMQRRLASRGALGQRGPRSIAARAAQSSGRSGVRNKEEETQTGGEGVGYSDEYKSISEGELGKEKYAESWKEHWAHTVEILKKDVAQKEREKMYLKAKVEEQEQVIKASTMDIEVLQEEVEETQLQAQQDGEEYKKQSGVLQVAVEVQRGTQKG